MLSLLLVLPALAASRAPAPPPPLSACNVAPLPTSLDPAALIGALAAPDPEAVSPWRAHVRTDVPVQLAPGVRAYAGDAIAGWHTAVVLVDGPTVTILTHEGPANLILGVDRSALAPMIARPVALAAGPGVPAAPMHVELTAGAEVRVLGGQPGFTEVAWTGDHLTATGWVPADALAPVAAPCALPDELHDVEIVEGGPALLLREAPDGRGIALVTTAEGWMGRSLGKATKKSGSWTAAVWTEGPMRVAGWAPAGRVKPTARAHLYTTRRWVDSYVSEREAVPTVNLPAGTVLTVGDVPFARLREPSALPIVTDAGQSVRVRLTTAWGSLEGVAACGTRTATAGGFTCSP